MRICVFVCVCVCTHTWVHVFVCVCTQMCAHMHGLHKDSVTGAPTESTLPALSLKWPLSQSVMRGKLSRTIYNQAEELPTSIPSEARPGSKGRQTK